MNNYNANNSSSGPIFACEKITTGPVVERAVAILTEIPLVISIAAVLDHRLRPAARTLEAIAPATLLQQVRGTRL
jgi:hypothetical protein